MIKEIVVDGYELFLLLSNLRDFCCEYADFVDKNFASQLVSQVDNYKSKYNLYIGEFYA